MFEHIQDLHPPKTSKENASESKKLSFLVPPKSALQGGTLAEAKKGLFLITFLIKNIGANHACQNTEFHGFSGSVHLGGVWVSKMMIFL